MAKPQIPLFITIPHAGESIPEEASWLKAASTELLLTDVDRFVDQLYAPALSEFKIPNVIAHVHRYAADLNRFPEDVDADSVEGSANASGKFTNGFHWVNTTTGKTLMTAPISQALHNEIVEKYHDSFHSTVAHVIEKMKAQFPKQPIYHLDCHSMPSQGTGSHQDSGKARAEVVVSDFHGKSSQPEFKDKVIGAFEAEGFQVAYNWPYFGGRITQRYGRPENGHHTIQIELNRSLYMNEVSKSKLAHFGELQTRLKKVVTRILNI